MKTQSFGGDKKVGYSLMTPIEQFFIPRIVKRMPSYIHGYHLTLTTVLWSLGVVLFSYLAKEHIAWLWMTSLMILLQYFTDSIDGSLNKYRNMGLIRWGYYMDHFLDFIFLGAILTGYSFLVDDHYKYLLFFTITIFGAYMVNSFLLFAATNEFKIAYMFIGPTEMRFFFVIINTLLIIYGKTYLGGFLPLVLAFSLVGLCWVVYRTQQYIWEMDMSDKANATKLPLPPSFLLLMRYMRSKLRKAAYKR